MKTAFIFPGHGAQRAGMGQAFLARHAIAGEIFERASAIAGYDMVQMCTRADLEDLRLVLAAQPAIFTVSAAALAVLCEFGIEPDLVAGHGVGEITAMYAAAALSFDDALALVIRRAELMAEIRSNGAMVSVVGLDASVVEAACAEASDRGIAVVGVHNGLRNFVVSGDTKAVLEAARSYRQLGATKVARLHTRHAFHSPLMEPIVTRWKEAMAAVPLSLGRVPVAVNATGVIARTTDELRAALVDQMNHAVRWHECMETLVAEGAARFIEVGDSKILTSLVRSVPGVEAVTLGDPRAARRLLAGREKRAPRSET